MKGLTDSSTLWVAVKPTGSLSLPLSTSLSSNSVPFFIHSLFSLPHPSFHFSPSHPASTSTSPPCFPPPPHLPFLLPVGRASNHVGGMSGLVWYSVCLHTALRGHANSTHTGPTRNGSDVVGKQDMASALYSSLGGFCVKDFIVSHF